MDPFIVNQGYYIAVALPQIEEVPVDIFSHSVVKYSLKWQ